MSFLSFFFVGFALLRLIYILFPYLSFVIVVRTAIDLGSDSLLSFLWNRDHLAFSWINNWRLYLNRRTPKWWIILHSNYSPPKAKFEVSHSWFKKVNIIRSRTMPCDRNFNLNFSTSRIFPYESFHLARYPLRNSMKNKWNYRNNKHLFGLLTIRFRYLCFYKKIASQKSFDLYNIYG